MWKDLSSTFPVRAAAALLVVASFAGCASLPPPTPRPDTVARTDVAGTSLHRMVDAVRPGDGTSGIHVISSGEEAYAVLATLADRAQRSLDLQYYLIRSDASSRGILERVHAAAERGVRVRLLVDDLNTAGQDDGLMRLTRHRNIEVRLYNPFPNRMGTVARIATSLTDLGRINQRMHNKMLVADNAVAVTGGRNLGDAYFLHSPKSNFLDLDILVAGPAVRDLSRVFDAFWNQPLAYPVDEIAKARGDGAPARREARADAAFPGGDEGASPLAWHELRDTPPPEPAPAPPAASKEVAKIDERASRAGPAERAAVAKDGDANAVPPAPRPQPSPFARDLSAGRLRVTWAPAKVIADSPSKLESGGQPADEETFVPQLLALLDAARDEVVIVSPYFVPGERGVSLLTRLRERGVKVRVLTNSLATTDAPAVHIGYARYREALLRAGVELHELRRHIDAPPARLGSFGSSSASLHAKVLVIDRRTALVGSMNMDPRSARLNSEMGVVIRSPEVSQQLVRLFDEVGRNAYAVSLDPQGGLVWTGATGDGREDVRRSEPEAKWWLRFGLKVLGPFAPDEML